MNTSHGVARLAFALGALGLFLVSMPATARAEKFFKGAARARAITEAARLREIQARHLTQLHAIAGVTGTGIGLDRATGRLIFDVMVDDEAPLPTVPAQIEGVPVRIVRQPRLLPQDTCNVAGTACHVDLQTLPVEMGNTGASGPVAVPGGLSCGVCSLGFKACDLLTKNVVYVTAAHCSKGTNSTCAGSAVNGAPTYHRSPGDAPVCALENVVGSTAKQAPPTSCNASVVDAASVTSDAGLTSLVIRDIGSPSYLPGTVLPGDGVMKSGRTTGFTLGIVTDIAATANVVAPSKYCNCPGGLTFVNQLRIERAWNGVGFPVPAATTWSRSGDSGSAVLTDEGAPPQIVGLNVLGTVGGNVGYANPIADVLGALDLSLNVLDCTDPCAATEASKGTLDPGSILPATRGYRDQVLSSTPRGRRYIALFYRVTADVVNIMSARPNLLARTGALYQRALPFLKTAIADGEAVVEQSFLDAVDALLSEYQEAASENDLKNAIRRLRRDLRDPDALADLGIKGIR